MRRLDQLDEWVLGPAGEPPSPRRMRAAYWFGLALVLALVVAGFVASGSNNPAVWPLAGMALGSLVFGGRSSRTQRTAGPTTGHVHAGSPGEHSQIAKEL